MATRKTHQRAILLGVIGFVITLFITDWAISYFSLTGAPRLIVALFPAIPLTYWWLQYPALLKKMDELEKTIELEALAKGGGLVLWLITIWALLVSQIDIPDFPLFLVAPIFVIFYALARWLVARKYK